MHSGDVINMTENKINPALHFQFLILLLFTILFSNNLIVLVGLFVINIVFYIYHKVYLFSFIQSCKKLTYCYFGICIIIAVSTLNINFALIIWIQLTLISKNILYYFEHQDWMELLYGLDCSLWIFDYIGITSSKVAWDITKFFRDLEIYLRACQQYAKKVNIRGMNFQWNRICDKIDSTKEILSMASYSAKREIRHQDEMMQLKLFVATSSRSNYHVAIWKPLDFIFLVSLICLLAGEVIL